MSTMVLEAQIRTDMGKGASRRLRRLKNMVPGIVYGGEQDPQAINLSHNKVIKALENDSIYSSVFDLNVEGKVEHVLLKDLQRHPYKPVILHMDLQRISAKDVLVKNVPLHFVNQELSKGVKAGGLVNHSMNHVEIRCQAKDLPEFIEVNMAEVGLNDVIHLSDLKLPTGVQLTVDLNDKVHNLSIVSVHLPKVHKVEEDTTEVDAE